MLLWRVLFLAVRQSPGGIGEEHHDRHVRHHLRRVVQRTRWQLRGVTGDLTHRLFAQLQQMRIERPRLDAEERRPLDRHLVLLCKAPRCFLRLAHHRRQNARVERALIDRNLGDTGDGGHDSRFDLDHTDGADDAGTRL